ALRTAGTERTDNLAVAPEYQSALIRECPLDCRNPPLTHRCGILRGVHSGRDGRTDLVHRDLVVAPGDPVHPAHVDWRSLRVTDHENQVPTVAARLGLPCTNRFPRLGQRDAVGCRRTL